MKSIPIGEICKFEYGSSLRSDIRQPGDVPVYGSNGQVGWHNKSYTDGPTLIIGRKGSIGEVHYSDVACFPIDTTYYVDKTKRPCDLKWLYYMLLEADLTRLNKSAAVPGLNRDDAYRECIPFPPLDEQKRIAAILEGIDYVRHTRRFTQSISNNFLREVFVAMFGDPVTNPKGWRRAAISELGTVETGNTPSRENSDYYGDYIEWIKTTNILKDSMYLTLAEEMLSVKGLEVGRFVNLGATMVTCIAGSVSSIGDVAYVDRKVAFNQQINAITPFEDIHPLFLYGLMRFSKPIIQDKATQSMKRIITKSKFEKVQLFKPPYDLQCKFAEILQDYSRSKLQQQESARQAEHLFQTLLHRAFRGEL